MDFRVGEDQRELAEGIRAMLAGRLPLEHLPRPRGRRAAIERGRLGGAGRDRRLLADAARAGRHRPRPGRRRRRLRGAGPGLVPGPLVGTFLAARAGPGRRARPRDGPRSACTAPADRGPRAGRAPGLARRAARPRGRRPRAGASCSLPRRADGARSVDAAARPAHAAVAARRAPGRRSRCRTTTGALRATARCSPPRCRSGTPPRRSTWPWPTPRSASSSASRSAASRRSSTCAPTCWCGRGGPGRRPRRRLPGRRARRRGGRRRRRPAARPASCSSAPSAGAKLLADEAAITNARAAIQVHGGMGFTWEVPLHLHLKRSRVLATTFGTPAEHAAALAAYA